MDKWEDTVLLLVTQLDFKRNAERQASDLQQSTEGHFKQEDIEAIYDDANRAMLERQAEISFKAGKDKGKQEGFDKAVEWIEKHKVAYKTRSLPAHPDSSIEGWFLSPSDWQAFLKERG